jgi:hypothetical protein
MFVQEKLCVMIVVLALSLLLPGMMRAHAETGASVRDQFANPGREYTSGPLWVWNDMLTEDQVRHALGELAKQNVRQPFVHPRPGLMTPYLGDDWFRLWKVSLEEAEKHDMNIWIYDENSYPSGFAGGFVPEAMPESHGLGLTIDVGEAPAKFDENMLGVYRLNKGEAENVTDELRDGAKLPKGRYAVAKRELSGSSAWFGGKYYVDLLKPGVTEKFLEITMGAYKREIGDQFGKRVPGVFTDEPHLRPGGKMHWSDGLPEEFEKRWGYSLLDNLASLQEPVGDWKRVRHNYFQTLLDLFIERWSIPYHDYCEENNLEFTGHYWEHGWPGATSAPDNMAMYAWHQRPATDILFNNYGESPNAQFGNVRAGLELQSVANQMGRKRTLCEVYGGSGWDVRFEDLKRIGDWIYVLGVNTMNQHLTHSTLRGARKRDYPPSFSYHTPWWDVYKDHGDYFARLSLALSSGKMKNRILVLEPTTTGWLYQTSGRGNLDKMGKTFQKLVTDLAKAQVEFDIGDEDIIKRNGSVDGAELVVGECSYHTVLIPPITENMNLATVALLEKYLDAGGKVLACDDAGFELIDGQVSKRAQALTQHKGWREIKTADAVKELHQPDNGFIVRMEEGKGIPYHHRRQLDDGEILFLVNTSMNEAVGGTVESPMKDAVAWDLRTGESGIQNYTSTDKGIETFFTLPPCGSMLLYFSNEAGGGEISVTDRGVIAANGALKIQRAEPNVLTLDYLDLTVGGETFKDIYYHKGNTTIWRKHGMDVNPWDHAVQFKDELISKTFPEGSGFEAAYSFVIRESVPKELFIVIERTDLYDITCNGTTIAPENGDWWLDKAFGKINIASMAKVGVNKVTIKANQMTMFHELEAAYLIGDFNLKAVERGFVVTPAQPIKLGPWNLQGLDLYSHGVSYARTFTVKKQDSLNFEVTLADWYGSVAKVEVNGKSCPIIYNQPYSCDVTDAVVEGENTVVVTVIGTLKNTLGPHHGNPGLGFAGPGSFHKAPSPGPVPGTDYSTIGYGLFAPFELHTSYTTMAAL